MKLYSKLQQMHFSSDRTNKSSAFRIEAQLAEPIRDDVLLEALKKAMELFPSTACRPVIAADKKHVGMIPNDVPPVIYHDETPVALGTDESNGYLFRVISKDHTIIFSVFHAVFDGRGAHQFMVHLLWFYLTGAGYEIDPEGMILSPDCLKDPCVTATLEEKIEEYGPLRSFEIPDAPEKAMVFHDTREDELYDTDIFSMVRIAMPFAQLKQVTKELGTSPMLLFYVLGAQAMRETCDVGDKVICCCFAADLRSRLNSRSLEEFSAMSNLYFYPGDEQLSLSDQLKKAKAAFDHIMSGDGILCSAKELIDGYEWLMQYIDLTMMDQVQPLLSQSAKANSSTFFITNVGLLRFPKDMTPYLKNVQIFGAPTKYDPNVCMHTFGDTLYFSYVHNSTDDAVATRMTEKLSALGVDCRVELKQTAKIDYLGKLSFENDLP